MSTFSWPSEWLRLTALESSEEARECDSTARLLFSIRPDFLKDNADLDSQECFACVLHRSPNFLKEVKTAISTGNFEKIWEKCVYFAHPVREGNHIMYMLCDVPRIVSGISSKLNDLVLGKAEQVAWTLDQSNESPLVRKWDLETLMKEKRPPSMLLCELGSFKKNPILNERVHDLFRKGHNTFLVNASATGKTRLLYEGLCQHWGLYVTAHADECEARALDTALEHFDREKDITRVLPPTTSLGFQKLLARNREAAGRRLSAVLLSHMLIFRDFLTAARDQVDGEHIKTKWLLAQLYCPFLWNNDPYTELFRCFQWASPDFLNGQLADVLDAIKPLLPKSVMTDGLFVTIDEANIFVRKRIWFSPHGDVGPFSVLQDMIRVWRDHLARLRVPITFVVAGVEIGQAFFPPSSLEWSSWRWTSNTGAFDDPEVQKKYILSFLPPLFEATVEGEAFLRRAWNWCKPRHRLTASLVTMLFMDKLAHPHGVLDQYITGLTGFKPREATQYTAVEGACSISPFFSNIGGIVEDRPLVRSTTHEVIMHYIITGKHPPCFGEGRIEIVSSGVGEFKDTNMTEIALDQSGPILAAAVWLSAPLRSREEPRSLTNFANFCSYFGDWWPNGDTYAPAGYIALYMAHVFKDTGNHSLADVFTITSAPAWLLPRRRNVRSQLVVLQKDGDNIVKEMVISESDLLPDAPPLGYAASSADDVVAWLRHERLGAFCVCPPDFGAELIFILKFSGGFIWVVLRSIGQGLTTTLDGDGLYPTFERLEAENLFSPDSVDPPLQESILNAFMALPNGLAPFGKLSMLRITATFPSEPTLRPKRIKGCPIGVLKTSTFQAVTESLSQQDLIEGLVSSMHGKRRSSYADDAFTLLETPSPPSSGKRKAQQSQIVSPDCIVSPTQRVKTDV